MVQQINKIDALFLILFYCVTWYIILSLWSFIRVDFFPVSWHDNRFAHGPELLICPSHSLSPFVFFCFCFFYYFLAETPVLPSRFDVVADHTFSKVVKKACIVPIVVSEGKIIINLWRRIEHKTLLFFSTDRSRGDPPVSQDDAAPAQAPRPDTTGIL